MKIQNLTMGALTQTEIDALTLASADAGLIAFNRTENQTQVWDGTAWLAIGGETLWQELTNESVETLAPLTDHPQTRIGNLSQSVTDFGKLTTVPDGAIVGQSIEVTGASNASFNGAYLPDGNDPHGYPKFKKTGTPDLYISLNSTTMVWYCIDATINPIYYQASYTNYGASYQPVGNYWQNSPSVPDDAQAAYVDVVGTGRSLRSIGQALFDQTQAQTHGADYFLHNLKSRPPIPFVGLAYFDQDAERAYIGDGTTWQEMSSPRTYTVTSNDDFKNALEDETSLYKILNITQAVAYLCDSSNTVSIYGYCYIVSGPGAPTAFLHASGATTITIEGLNAGTGNSLTFSQGAYISIPDIDTITVDNIVVNFELLAVTQHTASSLGVVDVATANGGVLTFANSKTSTTAIVDTAVASQKSLYQNEAITFGTATTLADLADLLETQTDMTIDLLGKTIQVSSNLTVNGAKTIINGGIAVLADITIAPTATFKPASLTTKILVASNRTITANGLALTVTELTWSGAYYTEFAWDTTIPTLQKMSGLGWASGVKMDFDKVWATNYAGHLRTLLGATTISTTGTKVIEWTGDEITTWNNETSQIWALSSSITAGNGVIAEIRCSKTLEFNLSGKTLQIGNSVVKLGDIVFNVPNCDFKGNGHLLAYNTDIYIRGLYNSQTGTTFYLDGSQPGGSATNRFYYERRDTAPNDSGSYTASAGATSWYNVDNYINRKWWSS